jgi:hypothetical protein
VLGLTGGGHVVGSGEPGCQGLQKLLVPAPAKEFKASPASTRVNNVANDGPELIEPIQSPALVETTNPDLTAQVRSVSRSRPVRPRMSGTARARRQLRPQVALVPPFHFHGSAAKDVDDRPLVRHQLRATFGEVPLLTHRVTLRDEELPNLFGGRHNAKNRALPGQRSRAQGGYSS